MKLTKFYVNIKILWNPLKSEHASIPQEMHVRSMDFAAIEINETSNGDVSFR